MDIFHLTEIDTKNHKIKKREPISPDSSLFKRIKSKLEDSMRKVGFDFEIDDKVLLRLLFAKDNSEISDFIKFGFRNETDVEKINYKNGKKYIFKDKEQDFISLNDDGKFDNHLNKFLQGLSALSSVEENYIKKETELEGLHSLLVLLSPVQYKILNFLLKRYTQQQIGETIKLPQYKVSREIKAIKNKIKNCDNKEKEKIKFFLKNL